MTVNRYYPLFLWLTTLAISPVLLAIAEGIYEGSVINLTGTLSLFPLFILFGLLFSIPCFVVVYILFKLLSGKMRSLFWLKMVVNIFCVICIWLTFRIIEGSMVPGLTVAYSAGVVLASSIVRVTSKLKNTPTEPSLPSC